MTRARKTQTLIVFHEASSKYTSFIRVEKWQELEETYRLIVFHEASSQFTQFIQMQNDKS